MTRIALPFLALVLAACPKAELTSWGAKSTVLAGEWVDVTDGAVLAIEMVDREPTFTGAYDAEGEIFPPVESTWQDGTLSFAYQVPSTGMEVHWQVHGAEEDADTLNTTYRSSNNGVVVYEGKQNLARK